MSRAIASSLTQGIRRYRSELAAAVAEMFVGSGVIRIMSGTTVTRADFMTFLSFRRSLGAIALTIIPIPSARLIDFSQNLRGQPGTCWSWTQLGRLGRASAPHGGLMLTVLGGLAEFERELIRARTDEGRRRAKARGVRFGRKLKPTLHQRAEAISRRVAGEPLAEIGRSSNVSHSTISR
jgi:hypothetical protein